MPDDANRYGWLWLAIITLAIWYWPNNPIDTKSASFKAGDASGYERGFRAGSAYVCGHLDETAPDIASDYRSSNYC